MTPQPKYPVAHITELIRILRETYAEEGMTPEQAENAVCGVEEQSPPWQGPLSEYWTKEYARLFAAGTKVNAQFRRHADQYARESIRFAREFAEMNHREREELAAMLARTEPMVP